MALRTAGGQPIPLIPSGDFKRRAIHWVYVVKNRVRWARDDEAFSKIRHKAVEDLHALGITQAHLDQFSQAATIQVDLPFTTEDVGWEFRILPWEFLLSAATGRAVVVVRHLQGESEPQFREPRSVTIVTSLPGHLRSAYEFGSEIALVRSNLQIEDRLLVDPTLEDLSSYAKQSKPDVVHLAGVDLHEGRAFMHQPEPQEERVRDGYFVAAKDGSAAPAYFPELSQALTAGSSKPILVCCNFYNSAARTAALITAAGASAAIGFQDEIDNVIAEEFFTKFYREWRASGWNLLEAFSKALGAANEQGDNRGTGIVLWSARPLLDGVQPKSKAPKARGQAKPLDLGKDLVLVISPVKSINYSLLHNDQDLFERFTLTNAHRAATVSGIRLYVELCVGDQNYPFRTIFDLPPGSMQDLTGMVRIPLTSTLFRSLRESIRSVLFVTLTSDNKTIEEKTYPVSLLAIDEWLDTKQLNAFLPSFVLSRDPAVLRVIDSAQKHLMTLSDDPGAGFDGYQGFDPNSENPSESVDFQAWAIWSALSYDFALRYTNPPPSFQESSQRLRSPSDVLEGHRGTCIDLALLLAACLEYVGVYPIIFLLNNHAFAGYWRSEMDRDRFFEVSAQLDAPAAKTPSSRYPWMVFGYEEVMQLVRSGAVSPLESVWLTQAKGFWEARDAGLENLRSPAEFEAMIDVQRARKEKVTPLPVVQREL